MSMPHQMRKDIEALTIACESLMFENMKLKTALVVVMIQTEKGEPLSALDSARLHQVAREATIEGAEVKPKSLIVGG